MMKQLVDQCRKKPDVGPLAIFLATSEGDSKVVLVAGLSKSLVDRGLSAGNWVKEVAPVVGGGGGGKPDLAQAGGKQPENIPAALQQAAG
jgi:alanyl-tRNA synthetase